MIRKLIFFVFLALFAGRPFVGRVEAAADYGVFIGVEEAEILDVSAGYRTIVVDGLSFSAETIRALKARGQFVYSYISEAFFPYAQFQRFVLCRHNARSLQSEARICESGRFGCRIYPQKTRKGSPKP